MKRVIGLPGETVSEKDGHDPASTARRSTSRTCRTGTVSDCTAFVTDCFPSGPIPANRYWVMGDNRADSTDSRSSATITKSEIVGRVFVRIWPLNRLGISDARRSGRGTLESRLSATHSLTVATMRSGRSQ